MYFPSADQIGKPTRIRVSSDHFRVSKSNTTILDWSRDTPSRYRPSGDQRGEKYPRDPGRSEIWWLTRSSTWTVEESSIGLPEKAILLPSGDQLGSD